MKLAWLFALTVALTVSYVTSRPSSNDDVSDHQSVILKIYQDIGKEDTHDFVRKEFPYADAKYYTEPKVVEKFMLAYQDGFLDKEGYFSLYSYKNRHDTYRLFDIFYFAKSFEDFVKIAQWAKSELNPIQFVYAFTSAVYHRKDTHGVIPPPFYEVLPHYFTPSYVMQGAYKAMIHDVKYRKFEVNGTGYEYSWYRDQTLDKYRFDPKYSEFDTETRMAYYREDVGINDWWSKFFLIMAPWLSSEQYPDIKWERRGEYMYTIMKWMLGKYNLERYANGLPPVEPVNFRKPIWTGFNPGMSNLHGRHFVSRPNGHIPYITNPEGVEYFYNMYQRYLGDVDSNSMFSPHNSSYFNIGGVEGFEKFAQIFYGIASPHIRKFYRPMYYQALETLDSSIKSSNDVGYTGSTIGNFMTELRDPAYFGVLTYLDKLFYAYNAKKTPYTKEEINFSGVKVSSFDFSKLETYFERYEYDISNGVPSKGDKYKYLASKWRKNHKPYTYTVDIQSDKQVDATVKIFFAPKYDANWREYGFNAFTKYGVGFDFFHVTLKPGSNKFERKSNSDPNIKETPRMKHLAEHLQRSQQKDENFHYSFEYINAFPTNLAIPRGSKDGTHFKVMVIVHPKGKETSSNEYQDLKFYQEYDDEKFILYPFDRPVRQSSFHTPNVHFSEVTIYDSTNYQ